MLFQQRDAVHGHATVHRFAHVINREQGDLHGGEGLHLDAGLADGFCRRGADHRVVGGQHLKLNRHTGQADRVAQRDQVAGFFGTLDASDAGDAQHVAFFGGARLDQCQRGGQHLNAASRHRNAARAGFAAHVHHVGLALGVEMGQDIGRGGHGCAW